MDVSMYLKKIFCLLTIGLISFYAQGVSEKFSYFSTPAWSAPVGWCAKSAYEPIVGKSVNLLEIVSQRWSLLSTSVSPYALPIAGMVVTGLLGYIIGYRRGLKENFFSAYNSAYNSTLVNVSRQTEVNTSHAEKPTDLADMTVLRDNLVKYLQDISNDKETLPDVYFKIIFDKGVKLGHVARFYTGVNVANQWDDLASRRLIGYSGTSVASALLMVNFFVNAITVLEKYDGLVDGSDIDLSKVKKFCLILEESIFCHGIQCHRAGCHEDFIPTYLKLPGAVNNYRVSKHDVASVIHKRCLARVDAAQNKDYKNFWSQESDTYYTECKDRFIDGDTDHFKQHFGLADDSGYILKSEFRKRNPFQLLSRQNSPVGFVLSV
jgi:hypothetical protein